MKKPKKKDSPNGKDCICCARYDGDCACEADWTDNKTYNQACDDYEAWLPTEDELVGIILKASLKHQALTGAKTIAHAIAKRLGREQ